jgi:hypothetical protein
LVSQNFHSTRNVVYWEKEYNKVSVFTREAGVSRIVAFRARRKPRGKSNNAIFHRVVVAKYHLRTNFPRSTLVETYYCVWATGAVLNVEEKGDK